MERVSYKKNDIVRLTIEDIGNDGEGIGRADGYTLFVKDAIIGDVIEARITKCKKNYGYGRVEKVVTPSPFRVEPKCSFHRQCGGCQIQAMSYERQLAYKQNKVRGLLQRIGGFSQEQIDAVMEPVVGMEDPWHYRNKAQYPVGYDRKGNLVAGFYAGRTHDIVSNTNCPLGPPENELILETILSYMRENGVTAYRESTGKGLVRHVLIRTGFATDEIMVCLVINGKRLSAEEKLVERLLGVRLTDMPLKESCESAVGDEASGDECEQTVPGGGFGREVPGHGMAVSEKGSGGKRIVSICVSVNTEKTNVIMGKEIRVLWGNGWIEDSLRVLDMSDSEKAGNIEDKHMGDEGKITFRISPLSFYQVNPRQTEKLYGLALQYAGLTGQETVWDLYCGIGTISLFMAKRAKKVYGVEVIPEAIEDAGENAARNQITNVEFFAGKAEEVLPAFYGGRGGSDSTRNESGDGKAAAGNKDGWRDTEKVRADEEMRHPDVIVVDPPRKGCDEKCLETMLAMQPERIVYVSCDPATLARDLKVLCGGGYELKKVRAVDQFGHTGHVETCVLLSRKKSSGKSTKIEIEIDLSEADKRECIGTATYQEIKDYIWEHYQTKVSHLYIAQIKKKCGLDVGENFNKPKTEGNKVPNCPPEKERMIREALEYFGMINKE